MSVTLEWTSDPFIRREKLKLIYDGSDSGSKKCKRGICGGMWSLRLVGDRNQTDGFVLVCLAGI
jgi:hypothetical protein